MILTASTIKRLFVELYGYRWAERAAEELKCSEKTIRRWASGEARPTARRAGAIRRLVDARMAELERWRSDLAA